MCSWFTTLLVLVWHLGDPGLEPQEPTQPLNARSAPSVAESELHEHLTEMLRSKDEERLAKTATNPLVVTAALPATTEPVPISDAEPPDAENEPQASNVQKAKSRVMADAGDAAGDSVPSAEHAALQGAAVELLTAHSECTIQTFTGRHTAQASSTYSESDNAALDAERHGAALAFDADATTAWHAACGLPNAPWRLSYRFAEPTTVSA